MNCKEHHLPELELATGQVREALQAILHTILFIRSPVSVTPADVLCEGFDICYTRISNDTTNTTTLPTLTHHNYNNHHHNNNNSPKKSQKRHFLDQRVDDSIESFLTTLTQIGPELLSGCLTLSFFERRESKQLFGLVSHEEKIIWEQWTLRVVVNNTPRPVNDDTTSVMERQRIQHTAEAMIRSVLFTIYHCACTGSAPKTGNENGEIFDDLSHIPPILSYEFDIHCSSKIDDRENVYSRVAKMPSLLNLDG